MRDETCPVPTPGSKVPDEKLARRRAICMQCDDRRSEGPKRDVGCRCRFCGCLIENLIKWSQRCKNPDNPKW